MRPTRLPSALADLVADDAANSGAADRPEGAAPGENCAADGARAGTNGHIAVAGGHIAAAPSAPSSAIVRIDVAIALFAFISDLLFDAGRIRSVAKQQAHGVKVAIRCWGVCAFAHPERTAQRVRLF